MLEESPFSKERASVLRIVSVPRESETAETRLLGRGVNPGSIPAAVEALLGKSAISVEEVVDYTFCERNIDPPFNSGRFGDGTIGVYYSAFAEVTCKKERAFHLQAEVIETDPRIFRLIECAYEGRTRDLRGLETRYPDLVSKTTDGYPFCQNLGKQAVAQSVAGFFTMSVRHKGGTCVPVFTRKALSKPKFKNSYKVTVGAHGVKFEEYDDL